jgi:hypothetical protein
MITQLRYITKLEKKKKKHYKTYLFYENIEGVNGSLLCMKKEMDLIVGCELNGMLTRRCCYVVTLGIHFLGTS